MPPSKTVPEGERKHYRRSRIEVDSNVRAPQPYGETNWECTKLTTLKENLQIAGKVEKNLPCDFAFLECKAPDSDLARKEILVPSVPSSSGKQEVIGVGYGGLIVNYFPHS